MSTSPTDANPPVMTGTAPARQSSLRSLLVLLLGASALLAFIVGVGDFRRKQNAIAQMLWHCETYKSRMGDTKLLPLNLEPDIAESRQVKMLKVFNISRDEARVLRDHQGRVIAGYTGPIPRALSGHGRAIAYFEEGAFGADWLTLDEFDAQLAEQKDTVKALTSGG